MKALWKDDRNLRENLQRRMPGLVSDYFEKGREAMKPGTSWEAMHDFRLATKRFRYTLELFRTAYSRGLLKRLDELKEVQGRLGDINDLITTRELLKGLDGMEAARAWLSEEADQQTKKLREYWDTVFGTAKSEERWAHYLVRFAGRPSRKRSPLLQKTMSDPVLPS